MTLTAKQRDERRRDDSERVVYLQNYRATPEWKAKHQSAVRKHRTGMDQATFDALLTLQGNRCAICSTPFEKQRDIHADHDHESKEPRGLLCGMCNTTEGMIKKVGLTPHGFADRLQRYLDAPPARTLKEVA